LGLFLRRYILQVVDQVVAFDTNKINCKKCPDKLTLSRKERETITAFHQNLIASLAALQRGLNEPLDGGDG